MGQRTHLDLMKKLEERISRALSPSEGAGFLYGFADDDGLIKVGRTNDFQRRQGEWDNRCPCASRVWLGVFPSSHTHRTGMSPIPYTYLFH